MIVCYNNVIPSGFLLIRMIMGYIMSILRDFVDSYDCVLYNVNPSGFS